MFPRSEDLLAEAIESLDGGANSRGRAWQIPPNAYADGFNIDISEPGVWKRRRGTQSRGTSPGRSGGFTWTRTSNGQPIIWAVWGSQLFRSTGFGEFDPLPVTNVTVYNQTLHMMVEGLYNNATFQPNQLRAIYGCQCVPTTGATEASRLFLFRGNQVTAIGHATQHVSYAPLVITYFQNRLWKANDQISGDGSDLAWSELDDGLTYSPANEIGVEPGVGGRITGLYPVRSAVPRLIVFKEDAIHSFTPRWGSSAAFIPGAADALDTLTSSIEPVVTGIGCIATRSIVETPGFQGGDVVYLARDGVRALARAQDDSLVGAGQRLSENIPDWIKRINFNAAGRAVASVHDNAYHLAVPLDDATDNSHLLRMELATGAWSLHTWKIRDMHRTPIANDDRMYMQYNSAFTEESTATGLPHVPVFHMYRAYQGDKDPGFTTVTYEVQTRALVFGNARQEKAFDRLLFLGTCDTNETHAMRLAYSVDFQDWTTLASVLTLAAPSAGTKLVQRRFGLRDIPTGSMVRFRISQAGTDAAQPQIYYMDVTATLLQEIYDNSR